MDVTLEVTKGSRKTRWIRLKSLDSFVGRRDDCDVRIPSARVSRRHCRLSFYDDLLHVEDLRSANGTFLNGEAVSHTVVVKPGDLLEIGPVEFRVNYPLSTTALGKLNGELSPLVLAEDVTLQSDPVYEELEPVLLDDDDAAPVEPEMELEPVMLEEAEVLPVDAEIEIEPVLLEEDDDAPQPLSTKNKVKPDRRSHTAEPVRDLETIDDDGNEILPTFDDDAPWNMPEEEDLRDILSKLEE